MTPDQTMNVISYFLLFYVIARLEWINYRIGKLEGRLNHAKPNKHDEK